MLGLSLGGGLSSRFAAWWGTWHLALNIPAGRYHPKGKAELVLKESRASAAWVPQIDGFYKKVAANELAIGQGAGLQVSEEVENLFANPTLQGLTSWNSGGDGGSTLTANTGIAPDGTQTASGMENQNAYNYGTQLYQGVAIVDTPMTISVWGYADEEVDISLKLNDNENNRTFTLTTEMQRFDHSGTIGPLLLGGGAGRCGFATGEDWVGKGVVIAWVQITATEGAMPFALGMRAADSPVVTQGLGGEILAEGDAPHEWISVGATLTDNADGTTVITSTGDTGSCAYNPAIGWEAGVTKRGCVTYKAGSSSAAKVLLRNSTASTESHLSGIVGALAATNTGAGALTIISQTLLGDEYTIEYEFVPNSTTSDLGYVGFGPNTTTSGETVTVVSASLKQVLPYSGYSIDGNLSAAEEINLAAFTRTGTKVILADDTFTLVAAPATEFEKTVIPMRQGKVQRLAADVNITAGVLNITQAGTGGAGISISGPNISSPEAYFMCPTEDSVAQGLTVQGHPTVCTGTVSNLSVCEIEPGVVFEIKAKWGGSIGQHAFRFDDGAGSNLIVVQQSVLGTVKLLVHVAGVDVINFSSAVLWPSDMEATFQFEMTKTDAGTFFAVFLDDVYLADIPSGPVAYPEAINQLKLAPVEGVSVIKHVYGK